MRDRHGGAPRWATTSSATTPRSTRCRSASRDAGQGGRAVHAHRHAEQPVRADGALRARRRVHRRPDGHTYRWEGGGAAVLGSIQPQPLPQQADGTLDAGRHRSRHQARRRALCAHPAAGAGEHLGRQVLPLAYIEAATALARARGWPPTWMAHGCSTPRWLRACRHAARLRATFDSVSVCFSKGLGAPAGSALVGRATSSPAPTAWRKMLAAACARPACWRPRRCMRWTTMSTAWPTTTPTRAAGRRPAGPARRERAAAADQHRVRRPGARKGRRRSGPAARPQACWHRPVPRCAWSPIST
jgi:hypothetical protein